MGVAGKLGYDDERLELEIHDGWLRIRVDDVVGTLGDFGSGT